MYCLTKAEGRRDGYKSIHFDKLSCRQVSFSCPKWSPSREEPIHFKRIYILTASQPIGLVQFFISVEKSLGDTLSMSMVCVIHSVQCEYNNVIQGVYIKLPLLKLGSTKYKLCPFSLFDTCDMLSFHYKLQRS